MSVVVNLMYEKYTHAIRLVLWFVCFLNVWMSILSFYQTPTYTNTRPLLFLKNNKKEKFVFVTLFDDSVKEMGNIMVKRLHEYCELHQCDIHIVNKNLATDNRHIVWSKLLVLIDLIALKKYDWIFWMDVDSLILNVQLSPDDLLSQMQIDRSYESLILSKDYGGFNGGMFLVPGRSDAISKIFALAYNRTEYLTHTLKEQEAMVQTIHDHSYPIQWVPQNMFNSYVNPRAGVLVQEGDFVVHFAGIHPRSVVVHMMQLLYDHSVTYYYFVIVYHRVLLSCIGCFLTYSLDLVKLRYQVLIYVFLLIDLFFIAQSYVLPFYFS